ncbi:MAG: pyridoxal-phosphate dependent enzyme, partial [Cyclobacteriaceae bacterium]
TPVITSGTINEIAGCQLYFKCENLQKVGAFKMRGATNAVLSLSDEQLQKGVATHSSGNHAQALALAAKLTGTKAYIVMPENAPQVKIAAVKGYGAEITFCEPSLQARESTLEKIVADTGATFIHPYNDPFIIAGQATAALELHEEVEDLDVLIAPVGGGGLLSGTALATHYLKPECKIIAAEPEGANDAWQSFQKGEIVPSTKPNTIADGLLTSLGSLTFPIIQKHVEEIITVDDGTITCAMQLIWERMKLVVEPSGAVPLAAILHQAQKFKQLKVGIIISGGNVDLNRFFEGTAK